MTNPTAPPATSLPRTIASLGINTAGQTGAGKIGDPVTITGTNFTSQPTIQFNGVAAGVTSYTATQVVTTIPVGATSGKVAITIAGQTVISTDNYIVFAPSTVLLNSFTVSESTYTTTNPHALTGTYDVSFVSSVPNVQFYVGLSNSATINNFCADQVSTPIQNLLGGSPLYGSIDFTEISATNKVGAYTTGVSEARFMIQPTPWGELDYTKPAYIVATICSYDTTQAIVKAGWPIYSQSQKSVPITITP